VTALAQSLDDDLLPCQHDPELWFADAPADLERAKARCAACPIQSACLAAALARAEYAGVWGGQIFERGRIIARKRRPGRPRKCHEPASAEAAGTPLQPDVGLLFLVL
jgi:WhiB family redox-sensing transcriptional regulator